MRLDFGYGTGIQTVEIPDENLLGVLTANEIPHERGGEADGRGAAQRGPFRFPFRHLHYLRHRVRGGVQRRECALKSLFFCHCFTPPPKSF